MAFWTRVFRAFTSLSPRFKRDYGEEAARDYSKIVSVEGRRRGRLASSWIALLGALDALKAAFADRAAEAPMLRSLGPDIRQAFRIYRREPLLALAVAVTLALGIGATTATYSVVNDILIRDLPVRDQDRLVVLYGTMPGREGVFCSYAEVQEYRAVDAFEWVGGSRSAGATWTAADEARDVNVQRVTDRFLTELGARFAAGRDFAESEPEAAVASPAFARRYFGSAQAAIGERLVLDDGPAEIVGVLAETVEIPRAPDLFRPYALSATEVAARGSKSLFAVARLRPGASIGEAGAQAAVVQKRAADIHGHERATGVRVTPLRPEIVSRIERPLWAIFSAVVLVLLVALTSVVSLLLSRAAARAGEVAVRVSLGASRARLSRLWLSEALALALPGVAGGIMLAYALVGVARAALPPGSGRLNTIALDQNAVAFAAAVMVVATVLFSLAPRVLGLGRMRMVTVRDAARSVAGLRRARWQSGLIAGQVALSLVLVCCAVWLAASMSRLQATSLGFDPEDVMVVDYQLTRPMRMNRRVRDAFADRVLERARSLGAVESAAVSNSMPGTRMSSYGMSRVLPGAPAFDEAEDHSIAYFSVTPDFFAVLRMRAVAGRLFDERENAAPGHALVVSRSFAAKYLPQGAVGTYVAIFGRDDRREVVGVVDDVHAQALGGEPDPQVYIPAGATGPGLVSALGVRVRKGASIAERDLEEIVRQIDPGVVVRAMPLSEAIGLALDSRRVATRAAYAFAAIALLLAAINVYGLAALTVVQRRREIGIRMALGAAAREAVSIVVRRGATWIGVGALAGLAAAVWLAAPAIRSQLYQTDTGEPLLVAAAALIVIAIALVALWIPARRAASIDPAITLRAE
ncbi:MAG TPA: ABC transporter permease [Longimicrobiales bacterium]|nr:ABC transporter permease [Longimicrobiales bacterium]